MTVLSNRGLIPIDYGQKWLSCGIGVVLAACKVSRIKFGTMKIAFGKNVSQRLGVNNGIFFVCGSERQR